MSSKVLSYLISSYFIAATVGDSVGRDDVLRYFSTVSGTKIISGQHNNGPNSDPARFTRIVHNMTGVFPGLWGGDFLHQPNDIMHRQSLANEAIRQWNAGSIVALTWHACPPHTGEPCDWNKDILQPLTDDQWKSLIDMDGELYAKWMQRLSYISTYLHQLQDAGVVVIWRPIHEINKARLWWGGRPGAHGSRRLYQLTYEYLAPKFTNLIWTWCVRAEDMNDIGDYWPGADYVDVATMDLHEGMPPYPTDVQYQQMLQIAQGKPIALAEVRATPSPAILEKQPKWLWFMVWAQWINSQDYNTVTSVKATYNAERTLTQGELDFKGTSGKNLALKRPIRSSSKESFGFSADNAVDGNLTTRWFSDESQLQWIYVDLGGPTTKSVSRVVIHWDAAYAKGYLIQVSGDQVTWSTVYVEYNGCGDSERITLSKSVSARFVKLFMFLKGTLFRYAVKELEVYS